MPRRGSADDHDRYADGGRPEPQAEVSKPERVRVGRGVTVSSHQTDDADDRGRDQGGEQYPGPWVFSRRREYQRQDQGDRVGGAEEDASRRAAIDW